MIHLIHPAVVHFAVAFTVAGGLIEAAGLLAGKERWVRVGGPMVLLAVPAVGLAVLTGFLAENSVAPPQAAHGVLDRHEVVGLGALAVLLTVLIWKAWYRGRLPRSHARPHAVLLLLAVALVALGAYFGGELVYVHGVGVAPR